MTLLDNHLEQIALSSAAISELPFPKPKIFSNAILQSHDITALIRDTEPHERALFTLAPPEQLPGVPDAKLSRRSTLHPGATGSARQKHGSTVATLLGGELGDQIRKENARDGKDRNDVDVELLLRGAEKLCGAYPMAGASDRIETLRSRYDQLSASIGRYESRVSRQTEQLSNLKKNKNDDEDFDADEGKDEEAAPAAESVITEEDIHKELEEIEELEKKKKVLEERISGMERDLGGLLR